MSDAIERAARAEAERKGHDEYWCGDPDVFAAGAEWAVAHLRAHDDTTEQAAKVIAEDAWQRSQQWEIPPGKRSDAVEAWAECAARALAEAGLLAPAPLREEWGIRWDDGVWEYYRNRAEAEVGAGDEGTPVHRYVSEWLPVDPAEGDGGGAEREPTVTASQLRAFARLCVDGGDMTPAAARMLDRLIDGDGRAEG